MLIEDLVNEVYQYVITARLQSDPVERRFSQCRRMNGSRFLVNSLLKENINFWEEDLTSENQRCVTATEDIFGAVTREIVESVLDENRVEVTTLDVAKKFNKRLKCESYKILLKAGDNDITHYP